MYYRYYKQTSSDLVKSKSTVPVWTPADSSHFCFSEQIETYCLFINTSPNI